MKGLPQTFVILSSAKDLLVACATATLCVAMALGCKSPAPLPAHATAAPQYPARPTIPAPPFTLFHQTDNTLTLVTDAHATDAQLTALLYQLHDANKHHAFDALHLPQALIDKRDPIVWFHIYRGPTCASEKYTTGKYPCGPSYHAAADYTLGSFSNKDRDDAVLIDSTGKETHLWNPDTLH